jgi:hypothetical protein
MKARICLKYDLPIRVEMNAESSVDVHKRSYIHYLAEHQHILGAKCWATHWLFDGLVSEPVSVREYFGGVGLMSVILQNTLNITDHKVGELDEECVEQLSGDDRWIAVHEDAKQAMLDIEHHDLRICDCPSSSAITMSKAWSKQYDSVFSQEPLYVYWTDTSVSYPLSINRTRYEALLGQDLHDHTDYFQAFSEWLYKRHGYSIIKVGYRYKSEKAKATGYCLAMKGKHGLEEKHFHVKGNSDGFILLS